jgi:hypothetical protein
LKQRSFCSVETGGNDILRFSGDNSLRIQNAFGVKMETLMRMLIVLVMVSHPVALLRRRVSFSDNGDPRLRKSFV